MRAPSFVCPPTMVRSCIALRLKGAHVNTSDNGASARRSGPGGPRGDRDRGRGVRRDEPGRRPQGGPSDSRDRFTGGSGRPALGGRSGDFASRGGDGGKSVSRGGDGGNSATRGGQGRPAEARGGSRLAPKQTRKPEPAIPEGVSHKQLDRSVLAQLRTLSQENAEGVGAHLVMVAQFLDSNLDAAEAHAETAVRRAGRVPAAREALGLVAIHKGDWARALNQFRTVRRLSGSSHVLPFMVDCERALGRPGKALELAGSPEVSSLGPAERVELAIVVSGIRRDAGQFAAAAAALETPALTGKAVRPWTARLRYAYAEARLGLGDLDAARLWFARAAEVDPDATTDAAERLEELDGIAYVDLLDGEDSDEGQGKDEAGNTGPS